MTLAALAVNASAAIARTALANMSMIVELCSKVSEVGQVEFRDWKRVTKMNKLLVAQTLIRDCSLPPSLELAAAADQSVHLDDERRSARLHSHRVA